MTVTTERTSNGQFLVLKDGVKTKYKIYNGCLGASSEIKNEYGIFNSENNKCTIVGSLQLAKKTVTFWLKSEK